MPRKDSGRRPSSPSCVRRACCLARARGSPRWSRRSGCARGFAQPQPCRRNKLNALSLRSASSSSGSVEPLGAGKPYSPAMRMM